VTLPLAARVRLGSPPHRLEVACCALLTAAVAALLLAFGPVPGDAAVHLYRTFLVRSGALVWDNFYPFHLVDVAGLLGVCGVGAVVARRARADVITRRWFSCADMLYVELVLAGAGIRVG